MATPLYFPFGPLRLAFYVILVLALGLLGNVFLCFSLLIYPFAPRLAYDFNSGIANVLWGSMQSYFEHSRNGKITFSGDRLTSGMSVLVISNHQTYADFYLVHALALRCGMLGRVRYFAKDSLKWTLPIFGWSMWAIGMIMVHRNWTKDAASIEKSFNRVTSQKQPIWIVSYLEGTRKSPATLQASQKWCAERERPILKEVLWPKTKGFIASVKALRDSDVRFVYDLTMVYRAPDGSLQPPHPASILSCPDLAAAGWKFHVDTRVVALNSLPQDDLGLAKWVEESFFRKEKLISSMKKEWDPAIGQKWMESSFCAYISATRGFRLDIWIGGLVVTSIIILRTSHLNCLCDLQYTEYFRVTTMIIPRSMIAKSIYSCSTSTNKNSSYLGASWQTL